MGLAKKICTGFLGLSGLLATTACHSQRSVYVRDEPYITSYSTASDLVQKLTPVQSIFNDQYLVEFSPEDTIKTAVSAQILDATTLWLDYNGDDLVDRKVVQGRTSEASNSRVIILLYTLEETVTPEDRALFARVVAKAKSQSTNFIMR